VHRLRIGEWVPSAVRSIAADPFSSKVAVGRENGDIEICDAAHKWYCQARIPGMRDFKLQALVWSPMRQQAGRLFGISLRGFLFEVDLQLLRVVRLCDTFGGTAWSLAACPRSPLLAVGCEDGAVRLFRYGASDDAGEGEAARPALEFARALPTSGSRVLSLAFHPHPQQPLLFAGGSDGAVRCLEEETGRVRLRMLGDVLRGSVTTSIWCIAALPDSTVVTGDSRGQVQVWDGAAGVLMDSFRQHTADVLALAVAYGGEAEDGTGEEDTKIFAAGVDGKVICIQKSNQGGQGRAADNSWMYVHAHRAHSDDVLALAVCRAPYPSSAGAGEGEVEGRSRSGSLDLTAGDPQSARKKKRVSFVDALQLERKGLQGQQGPRTRLMLLSGGVDAKLCTYSSRHFARSRPTWIPPVPANTLVSHSACLGTLALRSRESLDLWAVDYSKELRQTQQAGGIRDDFCSNKLRVQLKGADHIHCTALSAAGDVLAASSGSGLRVFRLSSKGGRKEGALQLQKLLLPPVLMGEEVAGMEFAHALAFGEFAKQEEEAHEAEAAEGRRRKSKGKGKAAETVTAAPRTLLAAHCARRGSIEVCEVLREGDEGGFGLCAVQSIDHRAIASAQVQARANTGGSLADRAEAGEVGDGAVDTLLCPAVSRMVFSSDARFLAVLGCGSGAGSLVYVYDMQRLRLHWVLPVGGAVTDVAFRSSSGLSLAVLFASNALRMFDVHGLAEAPCPPAPPSLLDLPAPLSGLALIPPHAESKSREGDASAAGRLLLYAQGCCVLVRMGEGGDAVGSSSSGEGAEVFASPAPAPVLVAGGDASTRLLQSLGKRDRKRRRKAGADEEEDEGDVPPSDFVVFNKYRNLLFAGFLSDSQLVSAL